MTNTNIPSGREASAPDEKRIETLLTLIQPVPSARLHQKMSRAPWQADQTGPGKLIMQNVRVKAAVTLAVLAVLSLLFITPQGRTLAQEILLHFFTRASSDALPVQPFQLTPVPAATTQDAGYVFNKDIIEAGQRAGFTVLVPASLPEILSFEGASYELEHNIVRIFYRYNQNAGPNTDGLVLREERFQTNDNCELCGMVGDSAEVETIQIGDVPGEYVEGVWKLTARGPVWEPDPYAKTLRFQKDGMAFELFYMGMAIDKEDMIAIAESLK